TTLNGELVGDPDAGDEMHFSFFDLVQHIARTRGFTAGTILGSGTVSNADRARGISCLAARRSIEPTDPGKPVTAFLNPAGRAPRAHRSARRRRAQQLRCDRSGSSAGSSARSSAGSSAGGQFGMKLYSYWRSSSAHRVRIGFHLKGIPFEYTAANLLEGRQWE